MKQHAIRWTENLFSVKDYLVQKKGVASYQIDELFKSVGLPKTGHPSRAQGLSKIPPCTSGREGRGVGERELASCKSVGDAPSSLRRRVAGSSHESFARHVNIS